MASASGSVAPSSRRPLMVVVKPRWRSRWVCRHLCGAGLPVAVASAASNSSVVVTVVLSAIFLHQPRSRAHVAAIALTLPGATLLALSTTW